MALVQGPLMSMDASGTVGETLTFSHWKGRCYVRNRVIPANPKSALQTGIRCMMSFLGKQWAGLTALAKASYESLASASSDSPFNEFIKFNMNRWVEGKGVSKATPAAEAATAATVSAMTPTGGDNHVSIAITLSTAAAQWGVIIFRSSSSITALDRSTAVAVVPVSGTSVSYLDSGLAAGTYHYRAAALTEDGKIGTAIADATATVS